MRIILKRVYEISRKSKGFRWTETQESAFTYFTTAVRTCNSVASANEDSRDKPECLHSTGFAVWALQSKTPQDPKYYPTIFWIKRFPWPQNRNNPIKGSPGHFISPTKCRETNRK